MCLFACQHDNLRIRTSKHRMMNLGGRCIVQKSRPSSNLGVIAPGCAPPKMWRWATTLEKPAQAVLQLVSFGLWTKLATRPFSSARYIIILYGIVVYCMQFWCWFLNGISDIGVGLAKRSRVSLPMESAHLHSIIDFPPGSLVLAAAAMSHRL